MSFLSSSLPLLFFPAGAAPPQGFGGFGGASPSHGAPPQFAQGFGGQPPQMMGGFGGFGGFGAPPPVHRLLGESFFFEAFFFVVAVSCLVFRLCFFVLKI
jgi:hypothetical protein